MLENLIGKDLPLKFPLSQSMDQMIDPLEVPVPEFRTDRHEKEFLDLYEDENAILV